MFRAVSEEALVNRMGFNNPGAEAFCEQLIEWRKSGRWPAHPVGVNLGKSKITPIESAAEDYRQTFELLRPHADFFVINVSSPNTPNLRTLQDKAALDEIFAAVQEVNVPSGPVPARPILVKVAPDLSFDALDEILELVEPRSIAGIVGTNTTIERPRTSNLRSAKSFDETGGLSGRPLRKRSTEVVQHLYRQTSGKLPIIGVGGIFSADDAWEKIRAGASLLQVYSGMVFEGPSIACKIVTGLGDRMEREGFSSLAEAVGSSVK